MPPVNRTSSDVLKSTNSRVRKTHKEPTPEKENKIVPFDYEKFFSENKTLILNDPLREILLYPSDDVSSVTLPRRWRTVTPSVPEVKSTTNCPLLTRKSLLSYSSNWNLLHYKYTAYSGTYLNLPRRPIVEQSPEEFYIDEEDEEKPEESTTEKTIKEGFLLKGPEIGSEGIFSNFTPKLFKKRYCVMIRQTDGSFILEVHKDDKKTENKLTVVLDFCSEVVKNPKKGKYSFELRMSGNKGYTFATESDIEFSDWLNVFSSALKRNQDNQSTTQSEDGSEKDSDASTTSEAPSAAAGTLKGLEHSMNPLLNRYSKETYASIAASRSEARRELFTLPCLQLPTPEPQVEPFKETFGQRILIKCESLKFRLQAPIDGEKELPCQVEPYFTYLALFDVKNGKKLTENFHFDLNHEAVKELIDSDETIDNLIETWGSDKLDSRKIPLEWLKNKKQAIMSLTNPNSEIFLVVRIDKILQGSLTQVSEPYLKAVKDPRLGLKVNKQIKMFASRIGSYRMPFAWAAKPLFRQYTNELDPNPEFTAIYRQEPGKMTDDDILKILSDYRKPEKLSKFCVIPGWLTIDVQISNDVPNNTLTPSFEALKPFPLPPNSPLTLELSSPGREVETVHTVWTHRLYVRPKSLNYDGQKMFSRARNIACTIQIKDNDAENGNALKLIYGREGMSTQYKCVVLHHNSTPTWYDEIKIRLPTNITDKHHLLFTFYHISCDVSKKQENGVESCIGYAWTPLQKDGMFVDESLNLYVAMNLPANYLSIALPASNTGASTFDVLWVDSERPLFKCNLIIDSTIITRDTNLNNLFKHIDLILSKRHVDENDTCDTLKLAHSIKTTSIIAFLPTLFNQLFELMSMSRSDEVVYQICKLFIHYINVLHDYGRKDLIDSYVKYVFTCSGAAGVHDRLSNPLHRFVDPNQPDFLLGNKFMQYSSFFFDIIIKSMAMYLMSTGRIKMSRNERFNGELMSNILDLINIVEPAYILQQPFQTHIFNKNLANFLKSCLSFMDRGFVFRQIQKYLDKFSKCEPKALFEFKFTFLQIIASHEHYISLNLPIRFSRSPTKDQTEDLKRLKLTNDFISRFFLAGTILKQVELSLQEASCKRSLALSMFRSLLMKHEHDGRYSGKQARSRIALLYAPWLNVVLDIVNRLTPKEKSNQTPSIENGHEINGDNNNLQSKLLDVNREVQSTNSTPKKNRLTLYFDTGSSARSSGHFKEPSTFLNNGTKDNKTNFSQTSLESSDASSNDSTLPRTNTLDLIDYGDQVNRFGVMSSEEIRDVLLCFLYVLKYLDDERLVKWWETCTPAVLQSFFTILELCADHFQYVGRKKILSEMKIMTPDPLNKWKPLKARTLPARMSPPDFTKEPTIVVEKNNTVNRENLVADISDADMQAESALKSATNTSTEVALTVIDVMCLFTRKIGPMAGSALKPYIKLLELPQSMTVYRHLFAALRSYINRHSDTLFQGTSSWCGLLVSRCTRLCGIAGGVGGGTQARLRKDAAALLYLIMRANYSPPRCDLTRTHLQMITSISELLDGTNKVNYQRLNESLSVINCFATSDKAMKGTGLSAEVREIISRARTCVWSRAALQSADSNLLPTRDSLHATRDSLHAALAASCRATPALRHQALALLADHQRAAGRHDQAMCCQLHIAGLIAEYLKLRGNQKWGAKSFNDLSMNIPKEEADLKIDEGMNEIHYNEQSLLDQLKLCTDYVEKTERYELLGPLYRLIIPIYEKSKDFQSLLSCYQHLNTVYSKILELSQSGKRLLGRFYRVAFYGKKYFEDEDGKAFVYMEPKLTALSEVSEKFFKFYEDKFGAGNVKIIMDSAPVKSSDLDYSLAHIQVTWVKSAEGCVSECELESAHNVKRFYFDTPFTRSGHAHGSIEEQWCRHTVLTTEHWFPYIVSRSQVIDVQECERSPIEVAIIEMSSKIADLRAVLTPPYDIKKLQLRLQGSVCVQVNAGPLAYAEAFLKPGSRLPEHFVQRLKKHFKEFLNVCYSALQLNSTLISSDQIGYHEVLKTNFFKLSESVAEYIGEGLHKVFENGNVNSAAIKGVETEASNA